MNIRCERDHDKEIRYVLVCSTNRSWITLNIFCTNNNQTLPFVFRCNTYGGVTITIIIITACASLTSHKSSWSSNAWTPETICWVDPCAYLWLGSLKGSEIRRRWHSSIFRINQARLLPFNKIDAHIINLALSAHYPRALNAKTEWKTKTTVSPQQCTHRNTLITNTTTFPTKSSTDIIASRLLKVTPVPLSRIFNMLPQVTCPSASSSALEIPKTTKSTNASSVPQRTKAPSSVKAHNILIRSTRESLIPRLRW